jgi:hypothetical protein
MIITQVHLVLETKKSHSKICSFVTQHNATDAPQILREFAIGMLTAGMSTRAVAREFNVNFSNISLPQRLTIHPTGLTSGDQVSPLQPMTSTSGFFTSRVV